MVDLFKFWYYQQPLLKHSFNVDMVADHIFKIWKLKINAKYYFILSYILYRCSLLNFTNDFFLFFQLIGVIGLKWWTNLLIWPTQWRWTTWQQKWWPLNGQRTQIMLVSMTQITLATVAFNTKAQASVTGSTYNLRFKY